MRIYLSHSSGFDYQNGLYQPIRKSELNKLHEITFPHEHTTEQFNSKDYMKDCDLILAEVSYPSTGQGIELGWADLYKVPIVCFYRKDVTPSGSLKAISTTFIEYENTAKMIEELTTCVTTFVF